MKPRKLIFELTNKCNLHCKICSIWQEKDEIEFGSDKLDVVLKDATARKVKVISFTGGEPMLMDNFLDYYEKAIEVRPKAHIHISSNGFATEKILTTLSKLNTDKVSITFSLDGVQSHDNLRGQKGAKDQLCKTLGSIRNKFPEIQMYLKMTVCKTNSDEVDATRSFSEEQKIPFQVKEIEQIPYYYDRVKSSPDEYFSVSELSSTNCLWPRDTLFIGLDGTVHLCRKDEVGNIYKNPLSEILKSNELKEQLRKMKNCNDCTASTI